MPHSRIRPVSWAPSALGIAKAAPRTACMRLSITSAGRFGRDYKVAGKYRLGSSAPNAPFDHGNHGARKSLYLTHKLPQRVVPAERVSTRFRQFVNVVTYRKYLGALLGAENYDPNPRFAKSP